LYLNKKVFEWKSRKATYLIWPSHILILNQLWCYIIHVIDKRLHWTDKRSGLIYPKVISQIMQCTLHDPVSSHPTLCPVNLPYKETVGVIILSHAGSFMQIHEVLQTASSLCSFSV